MTDEPIRARDPAIRALTQEIVGARAPQIMRIVATVDALLSRGPADQLVAPLRRRLKVLRPPRPLRFARLMFRPLEPLIVPAARWRLGQPGIPRTALPPMADHVRLAMGTEAAAIEAEIAGHTAAGTDLIARVGQSLWPAAAQILADTKPPATWDTTGLGDVVYRPLADIVATLLRQAAALETLCAETANGLLPPRPEAIDAILHQVTTANPAALPMTITLLLTRLPEAAAVLAEARAGPEAVSVQAVMDQTADRLLRQLDDEEGTEARIADGTLADAGVAANRIATLLRHLDTSNATPRRRARIRAVRRRLDAGCQARFAAGLEDELLTPLRQSGLLADIPALESTARGLRILAAEARVVGSGATYDLLLGKAAEVIKDSAIQERLGLAAQLRLVEILAGSEAALAMLDQGP
ncbi:MAG: hypothetical protein P4L90_12345 [Rhodopila sp.]|nr:hypothetical protein [Rhodopila sp.]